MTLLRWFTTLETPPANSQNISHVLLDGVGVGLASAATPFLPVFLARLGASNFQVGLLTSMPAITGLFLAMLIGNFLQTRRNIIPWFATSRFLSLAAFTLTGLVTLFIAPQHAVYAILLIWALATFPQTVISITFSVVMNAVAGPTGRFELLSRRWAIIGMVTATAVFLAGQVLTRLSFPFNYQIVFIGLSFGGLLSYYSSRQIRLPDNSVHASGNHSIFKQLKENIHQVRQEKPFLRIVARRFVFLTGTTLGIPLFPLYFVHVLHASDAWIGLFSTAQTALLVFGYFFWSRQSRKHGSRRVLLIATLGMSFYPALIALTQHQMIIALISAISGIFQAGIDLVFFDELMKTIPDQYCPSFVSFDQSLQYLSAIAAPLLGALLADRIGISGALIVSAALRLVGFIWFALGKTTRTVSQQTLPSVKIEIG
ncbi:MAG: MFS transporter [Anaerolineaceae bacterium]|nr:MFS transporter [Anaerolineaceae bacterium]